MNDKKIIAYKNGHWFIFRFERFAEFADQLYDFISNPNIDFNISDANSLALQFYR